MTSPERTYNLTELAELGEVTPRTVRYYIGQGLLPSPVAEGPNTRYTPAHVDRLKLIRELQREHLPLAEIRARMERLGDAQVRDLLTTGATIREPRGTAFDYIQSVLAGTDRRAFTLPLPRARRTSPVSPSVPLQPRVPAASQPRAVARSELVEVSRVSMAAEPPFPAREFLAMDLKAAASESPVLDRSQWDRISLAPDVELHIRRPLSRLQNRRVERLLAIARHVLEEDQP